MGATDLDTKMKRAAMRMIKWMWCFSKRKTELN